MEIQVSTAEMIERRDAMIQECEKMKADRIETMLAGGTFEGSARIAEIDHDLAVLDVSQDRDEASRKAAAKADQAAGAGASGSAGRGEERLRGRHLLCMEESAKALAKASRTRSSL